MSAFSLRRRPTRHIEIDLTDEQIDQLRAVIDMLPLNRYIGLVVAVTKGLPMGSLEHEQAS